ncbi:hypothetical protein LWI29_001028 [Acer saccharum]|uniref:Uncharacterized protein n=1 Tax=Acer saccharum TaxID=4024 RepID=A0AA39SQ73_ACESA|nr:hypothetical protein LWI29_001028 [Acer saccharum]
MCPAACTHLHRENCILEHHRDNENEEYILIKFKQPNLLDSFFLDYPFGLTKRPDTFGLVGENFGFRVILVHWV